MVIALLRNAGYASRSIWISWLSRINSLSTMNGGNEATKTKLKKMTNSAKTGDAGTSTESGKSTVALPDGSKIKGKADWESIEKDWRAGIKTKMQMAEEHSVSRAAMDKRFKKLGIERDLSEKIRQKADALVTQQAVTQQVTSERLTVTEGEIVTANANQMAGVQIMERRDVARTRGLLMKLMEELEATTDNKELFANLGEIMSGSEEISDSMKALYRKAVSMPQRIDSMMKISNSQKVLIELERKVNGIDGADRDSATDAVEALRKLANGEG